MTQLTLASALDRTLAGVAANNEPWVALARQEARLICEAKGSVTTDELRAWADRTGYQPDSPHAWGAVFKAPGWVCIGRQRSAVPSNNGRYVAVWTHVTTARQGR